MRPVALILVLLLALAVTGCGGGGKRTIPTRKAESMLRQLDNISDQFDHQACNGATDKVRSLESQARALPSSVDSEVKRNLESGLNRLEELVARDCQRPTPTNTVPTTTTPTNTVPTTPTNTVPTTPTNTVPTTPTNTTPTNTVPTTPTTPDGGGVTVPQGTTGTGGAG